MHLDFRKLALALPVAGLLVFAAAGSGSAAPQGNASATIPNCVVAQNLEAIIDDSGSMASTDSDRFRADMVDILAALNQGKQMGAVQFGSDASVLFAPSPIGPNLAAIHNALNLIQADDGGTDYEAGFNLANAQNPSANARIFLSDGDPNFAPDPNVWRTPRILAYVVGFGSVDPAVLQQIATDTGGPVPFNVTNTSDLRTVAQIINARINCEPDPTLVTRTMNRQGQVKNLSFAPDGNTAQVVLSWPNAGTVIKAFSFFQGKGGGASSSLASAAKKKKGHRVRAQVTKGATYSAIDLSGIRKGAVRFKIKAKKLAGPTSVTAAIIR
jgi:von Willebrand factor type A domain-containing protein